MTSWRLTLLGSPSLASPEATVIPERRTLALLAYLALEGACSRSKLAGLLWPDSAEATARNNLVQTLRRLRQATGERLVVGDDMLQLSPELLVDAAELRVRAFSGDAEGVLALAGELLSGLDYDDLPDLSDWVYGQREALRTLQGEALASLAEKAEGAGRYGEAARHTERLIALDPLAESSHRTLMRLLYLSGDRPAALRAYGRLKETLERELSVEPLPETRELAHHIDRGERLEQTNPRHDRMLPTFVLRPPLLVGREEAWQRMEEAWAKGQPIYLTGEPGVGKTRLAQEFVASKGQALYLPAHPGYHDVAFAAAAGLARARMAAAPDARLPDWVIRELARILPDLLPGEEPPPFRVPEDRLRFFQAYFEMVRLTGSGFAATISDDVQYYDLATVELGSFMMSQPRSSSETENIPRYVIVHRQGDLPEASQNTINRLVDAGIAVIITLKPLDARATTALLESLPLATQETQGLADAIYKRTGGNTLFILETLRNLLETQSLGDPLPARLPLTSRVDSMIRQRLARLTPAAQRAVQAAATLENDFDPDLIGAVLDTDPLELFSVWEELERAQVFSGNRFSHDLLFEAAFNTISQPVRRRLHARCAEALAQRNANPERIAQHYLAAETPLAAVPHLRAAARRAVDELRLEEAQRMFDSAKELLEAHGQEAEAGDVGLEKERVLGAVMPS